MNRLLFLLATIFVLWACTKDEPQEETGGGTQTTTTQTGTVTATTQTATTQTSTTQTSTTQTATTQTDTTQTDSEASRKEILSFAVVAADNTAYTATVYSETIVAILPDDAPLQLTPLIDFVGASISPALQTSINFQNHVTYTVTAKDGSKRQYKVVVSHYKDTRAEIGPMALKSEDGAFHTNYVPAYSSDSDIITAVITVPTGTNIKNLEPYCAEFPAGATINPALEVPTDFTKPVTYTVTAKNGYHKRVYVLSVAFKKPTSISIKEFKVTDNAGVDVVHIKTGYLPSDKSLVRAVLINKETQAEINLTIKQLDQKQKVITAEVPSTTYQNGIYNLRLTLDDITERSEWNVVLINGTPHFGGIMDYFTSSPGKVRNVLVWPKDMLEAQVFIKKNEIDQYTYYLRKAGKDYPFIKKFIRNGSYSIDLEMPNEVPAPPAEGNDFSFVMKKGGKEYAFPLVNSKKQAIQVQIAGTPVIRSISKTVLNKDDEFTIYGENMDFDFIYKPFPTKLMLEPYNYTYGRHYIYLTPIRITRTSATFKITDDVRAGRFHIRLIVTSINKESEVYSQDITINRRPSNHPRLTVEKALLYSKTDAYYPQQIQLTFNEELKNVSIKEIVFSKDIVIKNTIRYPKVVMSGKLPIEQYEALTSGRDGYALIEDNGREYKVYFTLLPEANNM